MTFALPVCVGAVALFLGTANPFVHLPLLIILYPAALYVIGLRDRHAFRRGWWTGLLGAAASLYWIAEAVHDYGGFPWLLAAPCAVLLGMYVGLWGGLFARFVVLLRPLPVWRRCLAAGLAWYLLEWARGWFGTGFPWLTLASGQAAWPVLIQGASLIGAYGLSGLLAALGGLFAEAAGLTTTEVRRNSSRGTPFRLRHALAGLMLLGLMLAFGVFRLQAFPAGDTDPGQGTPVTLTLIQGNVRQDLKWNPDFQQGTLDKYLTLSRAALRAAAPDKPDLVIWPETSMPFFYQDDAERAVALRDFARQEGVALLFGGPGYLRRGLSEDAALFNRAFFVDARGRDAGHYDKEHLVPFGEYIPPGLNLDMFAQLLQGLGGFTPGSLTPPLRLPLRRGGSDAVLGMLICYEAIFPELARDRVAQGAQLLVNISNDAWYNRSSAPVQHLYLAALRAVEQERWLARGTNTGLTAFVDPVGRIETLGGVTDGAGLFVSGSLTRQMRALDGHTVYFALHPWLPALAFMGLLLIMVPLAYRRRALLKENAVNLRSSERQRPEGPVP